MSIRARLLLLALSIVVPAVLGTAYAIHRFHTAQMQLATESLMELTHAIADSVDRELATKVAALEFLAASPALERGDLKAFYDHARATTPAFERTIVLHSPSGEQVLNTRLPFKAPAPGASNLTDLRREVGEDARLVSNLYFAPVGKRYSYAVQVPVKREGKLLYFLSMGSFASTLQRLVDDQRLRAGWNASILDRQGTLVARRVRPADFVGKPGTDRMRAKMKEASSGVFETVRLDGEPVFTAYTPIGTTGWTMAVSMPKAELAAQANELVKLILSIAGVIFVLAALGSWFVARSIDQAVSELVAMARALGRGEPVGRPRSRMKEAQIVAAEVNSAGEKLRAANELLEARVRHAVDETRRAQDALLQHQKLEALGRLTGGIAHDFNNILQTLSMSLEVAARLAVRDSVKSAIETGKRAVERGTQLTRQLLTFGRTTGVSTTNVDLGQHLQQNIGLVRGALRENIEVEVAIPPDLWSVLVDPVQLDLAVLNVALNARDAMPDGGRFEIKAWNAVVGVDEIPDLAAGQYVCLSARDTGIGIAPEVAPKIFDPFFTTKPVGQGSGLGLAQVYGFAKQSGGTVVVKSTPGQGAQLVLYLPRSQAAEPVAPAKAPAAEGAPRDWQMRGSLLFVDDDELIRRIMAPALESAGFKVHCASNAAEALRTLEEHRIDVVLSDIVMPGGSGVEMAKLIQTRFPDVKVVLATGFSDELTRTGSIPVISKPYRIEEAMAVIRAEMTRSETRS